MVQIFQNWKSILKMKNNLQNHIALAKKGLAHENYSAALIHLHSIYHFFYTQQREIAKVHSNKNFNQIKTSGCDRYGRWKTVFLATDEQIAKIVSKINFYAIQNDKKYINVHGDDLLKKINSLRNHCNLFANVKS